MRILFTPHAAPTHVLPMVPLAAAFRAAGHDVRFAAQPRVTDTITRCGQLAVPVGDSHDVLAATAEFLRKNPALMRPNGRLAVMNGGPAGAFALAWIDAARAVVPELLSFCRWWRPDLLVTDPMFYAGPLAAEVLGIPLVRHLWGPDWTLSGFGMGGFAEGGPETADWPEDLLDLYESYGARTAIDFAVCTVDPFPPSLQVPGLANRITMRQVPYNGPGVLPDWLARRPARPRVCVTGGTTNSRFLGPDGYLVPRILEGLTGLDVEIVLAAGEADLEMLGEVPAGVRVVRDLPFDLLLPTCSAIVGHGGAGGMATAAAHGVPQVLIPQLGDQPVNARLVAAAGAGLVLDAPTFGPDDVRTAVSAAVFGEGPRAAARRIQAEIAGLPTPADTVRTLEDVVRQWTPAAAQETDSRREAVSAVSQS